MSGTATETVDIPAPSSLNEVLQWTMRKNGWSAASTLLCGPLHEQCEDASRGMFRPQGGINLALADGVSKGDFGVLAANAIANHCAAHAAAGELSHDGLSQWVITGDGLVADAVSTAGGKLGATCLVAAWFGRDGDGFLAHVGDCRAYSVMQDTDGIRTQGLTKDETFEELGVAPPEGIDARNPARMLGLRQLQGVNCMPVHISPGSGLLLCSDGLHGVLFSQQINKTLSGLLGQAGKYAGERLSAATFALAEQAVAAGSLDDVGVVMLWRDIE
jgi:serine/threonine protein phosphatase PrpC